MSRTLVVYLGVFVGMTVGIVPGRADAQGDPIEVDFTNLGTFSTDQLNVGEVTVTADDGMFPADVHVLNLNGLGVVGGVSDNAVDTYETLVFDLGGCATEVTYFVPIAGNLDGDATVGDSFVQAFVSEGGYLGKVPVNDGGEHDVSALFGGRVISGFAVQADVDYLRIGSLSYVPAACPTRVDFTNLGTFSTDQLNVGEVSVTADDGVSPALVYVLNMNGLGVVGGIADQVVDTHEALLFDMGGSVTGLSYFVGSAGNLDGDATVGDSFVEAFDSEGASLGTVPVNGGGDLYVSGLFGGQVISGFLVRADVDSLRINQVAYIRVCEAPDPPLVEPTVADIGNGTRNRYLAFNGGLVGGEPYANPMAIRVTFTDIPGSDCDGQHMWVTDPRDVSEKAASTGSDPPDFVKATLRCDPPDFQDWSIYEDLYVYHEYIVPGATFEIQLVPMGCEGSEDAYSEPLTIGSSMWGDAVGEYNEGACCTRHEYEDCWTAPNGVANFDDISSFVDKFRNLGGAPQKSRCDIAGESPDGIPDQLCNFVDISYDVDAFRGLPYPFPYPPDVLCP